jgi:uncharacterized protein
MNLHPFIEVTVNGRPVRDLFYSRLVSATIHDAPGQEADTVDLRFDDGGNDIEVPAKGAAILVRFGFRGFGGQKMGLFIAEKTRLEGGEDGEFLSISGRSADMRSDVKEQLSEHFDDTTVGGLVDKLAKRHGYRPKVDPDLASIKIPYIARYEQSSTDFLTRLADRYGGLFAVKDRKFILVPHGILPAVTIDKSECESWSFEVEPRPVYGKTEAGWYDRTKNAVAYEKAETGLEGSTKRLRRVFPTKEEALAAARSEGQRLSRATGSGSLTLAGRPDIMADAPIATTGFRSEINGVWRCAGVDHVYQETYMTTIEVEAPEEGKV